MYEYDQFYLLADLKYIFTHLIKFIMSYKYNMGIRSLV
jgi:hypothetical protein